ncbi:MAG: hypothetical protein AB8G23_05850 [Myxococcota bacterium]
MIIRVRNPLILLSLLSLSLLAVACSSGGGDDSSVESGPFSASSQLDAPVDSTNPPGPAPASVIDPHAPWSSLGELSGTYSLTVTRLNDDCAFGPDVPLNRHYSEEGSGPILTIPVTTESHTIHITQRGNALAFSLREGVVLATMNEASSRLEDVERIGAEGLTEYRDGFQVTRFANRVVEFSGESEWTFQGDYYEVGETCGGRTEWVAFKEDDQPIKGGYGDDLQVVLRWPAESAADLDLMVTPPKIASSGSTQPRSVDLLNSNGRCHLIHSVGRAAIEESDSLAPFEELVAHHAATTLPYHEEVVRCRSANWGTWAFQVVNWSAAEDVAFEVEAFYGQGVNTGAEGERSFGVAPGTASAQSTRVIGFELTAPTPGSNMAGAEARQGNFSGAGFTVTLSGRTPIPLPERAPGELSNSLLEWHKAALEGVEPSTFLERIRAGLDVNESSELQPPTT